MQGDGDYEAVATFTEKYAERTPELNEDLARLEEGGIPTDITYEQGVSMLQGIPQPMTSAE